VVSATGTQTPVPVFQCGTSGCVAAPMDLGGPSDTLVLVLYGTGIRNNSGLANVAAQIGGVPAQVNLRRSEFGLFRLRLSQLSGSAKPRRSGKRAGDSDRRRHHCQRRDRQYQIISYPASALTIPLEASADFPSKLLGSRPCPTVSYNQSACRNSRRNLTLLRHFLTFRCQI
jgi:hypothetical protein